MSAVEHGAFDAAFAARRAKRKKLDQGLVEAIAAIVPRRCGIVDVGCGSGELIAELRNRGWVVMGVDGAAIDIGGIPVVHVDLAKPVRWPWVDPRTWAVSFEVGEHIPAEFESVFIENITGLRPLGIMLSWAVPGQRGRNHVNCRPPEYVAEQFAMRGYVYDDDATQRARRIAGKGWDKKLLVMRKAER